MSGDRDRFAIAREVFRDSFLMKADPGGEFSGKDRAIRAELLRREHYRAISRLGVEARRQKREIRRQIEAAGE